MSRLEGHARLLTGLAFLGLTMPVVLLVLLLLLPWRLTRIHLTNHLGTLWGSTVMWLSGCPLQVVGHERVRADRPVIYACNHTSIYDAFTSIWLSPRGTVGVAKKEIVLYPFYGLAWVLSGHLMVDRANTARGKASMRRMGALVRRHGLHVFMFPEGTRSRDGRLRPLKKGIAHLALQTGLPVMPVVVSGAHRAWDRGSFTIRRVPIRIEFLEPIDTSAWSEATMTADLDRLHRAFVGALPPDQRPIDGPDGALGPPAPAARVAAD